MHIRYKENEWDWPNQIIQLCEETLILLFKIVGAKLTLFESLQWSEDDEDADVCCMALSCVLRWNSWEARDKKNMNKINNAVSGK